MFTFLRNRRLELVISVFALILVTPLVVNAGWLELGVFVMQLFARLTGWAGVLLNIAIMELVFNMGTYLSSNVGASVENAWALIRDLMNLLFIFSLVYIGFLVILDASSSTARRLLPPLIIAALLVNFSLFFTKFMVDVSNIAAVEIYNTTIGSQLLTGVAQSQGGAAPSAQQANEALVNVGISGAFMQSMGLKDLLSPNQNQGALNTASYELKLSEACGNQSVDQAAESGSNCSVDVLVYFFLSIIFFLVAAYAFFIGAFMLVWRFLVLIFLLIFSPLMFVGMIFPNARRFQQKWWQTFIFACLYAPAYLLMLFIAYTLASRINVFDPNDNMYSAVSGAYSSVDLILNFLIVIGFLLAATYVGKEMSFVGSRATVKFADNTLRRGRRALARGGGMVAGAGMGLGAYGLRNTAGRREWETANAENEKGKRLALQAQGKGIGAWYARQRLAAAERASQASFDPRQAMGKDNQKLFGSGAKGGYEKNIKDRTKAEEKRAKRAGQVDAGIYDEYGVKGEYDYYKLREKTRDQYIADRTSETDPKKRRALTLDIARINSEIKDLERAGNGKNQQNTPPEWYINQGGTEEQWENFKIFAQAKKEEKGHGQRTYANSLKTRYDSNVLTRTFGRIFDDPTARKAAAKEITKKNTTKNPGQRIEDIIKSELNENQGDTPDSTSSTSSGSSSGGSGGSNTGGTGGGGSSTT